MSSSSVVATMGWSRRAFWPRPGCGWLIIEKAPWLGGMAASRPFVAEAPEHILSPGAWENVYFRAAGVGRELSLERYGHRDLEAFGWAWLGAGGESLVLQRDLGKTIADIRRFSRKDADTYAELTEAGIRLLKIQDEYGSSHPKRPSLATVATAMRAITSGHQVRSLLGSALTATAADGIESLFESEAVRGILARTGSILAPLKVDGSAIALLDKVAEAAPEFEKLQIGAFTETAEDRAERTGAERLHLPYRQLAHPDRSAATGGRSRRLPHRSARSVSWLCELPSGRRRPRASRKALRDSGSTRNFKEEASVENAGLC